MVARKSLITKDKEKRLIEAPPGRKPPKVDLASLADAFRDDSWHVPVGGELIVERRVDGKRQKTLCIVKRIDEGGIVHAWDETLDRWFLFEPGSLEKNGVTVKVVPR